MNKTPQQLCKFFAGEIHQYLLDRLGQSFHIYDLMKTFNILKRGIDPTALALELERRGLVIKHIETDGPYQHEILNPVVLPGDPG